MIYIQIRKLYINYLIIFEERKKKLVNEIYYYLNILLNYFIITLLFYFLKRLKSLNVYLLEDYKLIMFIEAHKFTLLIFFILN
jgi:hypothetical protein